MGERLSEPEHQVLSAGALREILDFLDGKIGNQTVPAEVLVEVFWKLLNALPAHTVVYLNEFQSTVLNGLVESIAHAQVLPLREDLNDGALPNLTNIA